MPLLHCSQFSKDRWSLWLFALNNDFFFPPINDQVYDSGKGTYLEGKMNLKFHMRREDDYTFLRRRIMEVLAPLQQIETISR